MTTSILNIQNLIYSKPIEEDLPRRLFQEYSKRRLSIYQAIDSRREEMGDAILEQLIAKSGDSLAPEERDLLIRLGRHDTTLELKQDKIDIISHYICRLMFCLSQERKDNFVSYETAIFKSRLRYKAKNNSINEKELFECLLDETGEVNRWGEISEITPEELAEKKEEIFAAKFGGGSFVEFKPKRMYKVPVESCEYLVSRRECFVHQGYAYVEGDLLLRVIPRIYSKYLRMVMDHLEKHAAKILADDTDNQFRDFIRNEPSTIYNHVVAPEELK